MVDMQREGKLTTGMLDSIADAGGPSLMQVAKHIKGLQGMPEKQVRAMIDGGGISGKTGQVDVMKAINEVMNKGKGLGASAKEHAATDPMAQMDRAIRSIRDLIGGVDLKPIVDGFKAIADALDTTTPAGKRL